MAGPQDDLLSGYTGSYGKKAAPNPSDTGSKVSGFIGWAVGLFLLIVGLGSFVGGLSQGELDKTWVGLPLALAGLVVLPPVTRALREAMPIMQPVWVPPAAGFAVLFITSAIAAIMMHGTAGLGGAFSGVRSASSEQVEACRWELVSFGIDPEKYDWDRAYVRGVYNETNAPMPTRINGQSITCVLVPEFGAETSSDQCGLFGNVPDSHWACRMVRDAGQGTWIPTWKAR